MPVRGLNGRGAFGMSDTAITTADAGEKIEQAAVEQEGAFRAPASQEELDRIIQKRLERERSRFTDYDDLKARAEKASELEAVNADLVSKVQSFELSAARGALVQKVADETGVDAEIVANLRGDSEEELTALASKIGDRLKQSAPLIPGQEKFPGSAPRDEMREFANALFAKTD